MFLLFFMSLCASYMYVAYAARHAAALQTDRLFVAELFEVGFAGEL